MQQLHILKIVLSADSSSITTDVWNKPKGLKLKHPRQNISLDYFTLKQLWSWNTENLKTQLILYRKTLACSDENNSFPIGKVTNEQITKRSEKDKAYHGTSLKVKVSGRRWHPAVSRRPSLVSPHHYGHPITGETIYIGNWGWVTLFFGAIGTH